MATSLPLNLIYALFLSYFILLKKTLLVDVCILDQSGYSYYEQPILAGNTAGKQHRLKRLTVLFSFQSSKPGSRNLWVSLNRTKFRLAEIPTSSPTKVR